MDFVFYLLLGSLLHIGTGKQQAQEKALSQQALAQVECVELATPSAPEQLLWFGLHASNPDMTPSPGPATSHRPWQPVAPTISATKADAQVGTDNGPTGPSPGDMLEYTIVISNTGNMDATATQFTDNIDVNTTLVPGSLQCSPIGIADSYNVLGNVSISVPAGSGLLVNDLNPCGTGSLSVSNVNTSGTQGNVTFMANGSFTFNPAAGFNGTTTFEYTVSNGTFTNTATVTLTVSGLIWFIDNNSPNGDGRLGTPFSSIANFNTGASGGSVGNTIFLYRQTASNYSGAGLTLKNNQFLIGQGASSSIVALTGITLPFHSLALPATGGTNPVIAHNATAVTLASNNKLHGFNVSNSGGTGIFGSSVGNLRIRDLSVANSAGTALNIASGVLDVIIKKLDAAGATTGFRINSTTGSFLVEGTSTTDGTGGLVQNITERGADIQDATNITLKNMNFTNANTADAGGAGVCDNEDNNLSCHAAIYLRNITTIVLDNLNVFNTAEQGLNGNNINGMTIANSRFSNCGDGQFEGALKIRELHGTCSITNSEFDDAFNVTVEIINVTTTNPLNLSVTNSIFRDNFDNTFGENGLLIITENTGTSTINVVDCDFLRIKGQGINIEPRAGTMNVNVTDCLFDKDNKSYMAGVHVLPTGSANVNINILRNTMDVAGGNNLMVSGSGNSVYQARINDNTMVGPALCSDCFTAGDMETPSCLCAGDGITVWATINCSGKAEVVGNDISGLDFQAFGIYATSRNMADLTLLIHDNDIEVSSDAAYGINFQGGNADMSQTATICANVTNNRVTFLPTGGPYSGPTQAVFRIRSINTGSIINIQGAGATLTQVWVNNGNMPVPAMTPVAPDTVLSSVGTGGVINLNQNCPLTLTHPTALTAPADVVELRSIAGDIEPVIAENPETNNAQIGNPGQDQEEDFSTSAQSMAMMETVSVGPFTLPAAKSITIKFRVTINDPIPLGVCSVSNQGTVSGSNFSNVLTDDPDVAGAANPTVTLLTKLTLGNQVYNDANRNGVFDMGDNGIDGVALNLYADNGDGVLTAADGPPIANTSTAGGGLYSFAVCTGNYIVEVAPSNFAMGGALYNAGVPYVSSPVGGAPDPDNDIDNDDNGDQVSGFGVASQAITLTYGAEPINDGDTDNSTNLTLDFGFKTPTIVTISDVTMNEGTGGSTTAFDFTVMRSNTGETFSLTVNTMDGTAVSPSDFTAITGGSASFTAGGSPTATVTVLVNQDAMVETNETFTVLLSGAPGGVIITDGSGLGTITNDDNATITLTGPSPVPPAEGNAGTTSYIFTATLSNPVQGGVSVAYTTNDGTATLADNDYVNNDGTLNFPGNTAGETQMITVLVNGDTKVEPDETFAVVLGTITGAPIAGSVTLGVPSSQTGTIVNDDNATITLTGPSPVPPAEGNAGTTSYIFTATLSNPVQGGVSVAYTTNDGNATLADNDYVDNDGTLNFPGNTAGETQMITVLVNGDIKVEADETFTVVLGTITGAPIAGSVTLGVPSSQTGTIVNDDNATITLSGSASVAEGNSGQTPVMFTATLNNPVQGAFTVAYNTNDGTATVADNDYMDNDGTLMFSGAAGQALPITVQVNGDLNIEANETFTVTLGAITGAPAGVTAAGSPQTGTILNDEKDWGDAPTAAQSGFASTYPTLAANTGANHNLAPGGLRLGATVDADLDGQPNADATGDGADEDGVTLPVTLITGTTANITVNASGPGNLQGWVDFNRDGDWDDAGEQVFTNQAVVAGNNALSFPVPGGASIGTSFARFRLATASGIGISGAAADGEVEDYQVNILNNQFTVDNPSVIEGNLGTTTLTFTISRTTNSSASSVDYAVSAGTATLGTDYASNPSGTINFTMDGPMFQTVAVTVNSDLIVEGDETIFLTLSNPVNGGIGASPGTGTITNDDAATVTLSGGISQNETNAGTVSYTFTATLNAAVQDGFEVAYATGGGTATAGTDYTDNDGTLIFDGTVGETKSWTVNVNGDNTVELDETFEGTLGAISMTSPVQIAAISVAASPQTSTILNDDAATVSIAGDVSQAENLTPQVFTVNLSNPVDVPVTVLFNTSDGTAATADNDYTGITNQTVTFAANTTTAQTVNVTIVNDNKVEADEVYNVALSSLNASSRNVNLGTSARTGTILNDDAAMVTLSGSIEQNEGNVGPTTYTFIATLNNPVQGGFTVPYTTNDGTATTADNDYQDNDGTLTFAGTMGEPQTITVQVNGDLKVELNETFTVALGAITGAPAGVTTAGSPQTGTITNDDAATVSLAGNVSQAENLTPQVFTVNLSNPVDMPVTVLFNTSDGTATTADNDYTGITNQTVTFAANTTTAQTVNVTIVNDNKVEADEVYNVALSSLNASSRNVSLGTSAGTGAIVNDDAAMVTLSGGISQNETNAGTVSYTFTATLNAAVQDGFEVAYATGGGTATAGTDYTDNDGTLTFDGTVGETKSWTVNVNGDNTVELDETFEGTLGAISMTSPVQIAAISVAASPQTSTILNDDAATVSIAGDVSQAENLTPQVFTVNLSNPVDVPVTVLFNTSDGTAATADNDYTGITNQTVTFAANTTTAQTVNVTIVNDNKVEANEVYNVALSSLNASSRNVSLGLSAANGTIVNDDNATVTLTGTNSVIEGNSGQTPIIFVATLDNPVQGGFTVNYTTNDGTATVADNDYVDNDGSFAFIGTMGEFHQITVQVNGDLNIEADETFTLTINTLTGVVTPAAVTIFGSPQTGTILNDELDWGDAPTAMQSGLAGAYPTLSADNGARHTQLPGGLRLGATVDADLNGQPNATATGDGADEDGVTLPSALVINTTANVTVNASASGSLQGWVDFNRDGDWTDPSEQIFTNVAVVAGNNNLSFAVPAGATLGTSFARFRVATISGIGITGLAADGEVEDYAIEIVNTQFSINDTSTVEGNVGLANLDFVISRTVNANDCSVDYAITGGTAQSGSDYQVFASGTAHFLAGGPLTQTITVQVIGDNTVELDETVLMTLSNPVSGSILDGSGTGTIFNDDAAEITVTSPSIVEGDAGTSTLTFTLNLSNPSDANVSVNYTTVDGSATTANSDYVLASGSHTFTPGQQVKTVAVTINGDCAIEPNETFLLRLSALVNNGRDVTLSGGGATLDGTGTITNDDALPVINCPLTANYNTTPGLCNATVTLPLPALSSICGSSALEFRYRPVNAMNSPLGAYNSYAPSSGNTVIFAPGRYEIEWRVTDASGSSTCSYFIEIIDNEPPMVACSNQTVTFNGQNSIPLVASQLVTTTDNCGVLDTLLSISAITCVQLGQVVPVTVTAKDAAGNMSTCISMITVAGLPCGWSHNSGSVGCGSTMAFAPATGVWTATATGCYYADPYTNDEVTFAQRTLCGDGSITARVTSIGGVGGWAGVTMRETNALGAKKVQLMTNLSNFVRVEVRYTTGGQAYPADLFSFQRFWVRIMRQGNEFIGFVSSDGLFWIQTFSVLVPMNSCIEMGLVMTNFMQNGVGTATFSNVSTTGSNVPPLVAPDVSHTPQESLAPIDFSVFPNPTSGELNVELEQYMGRAVRLEVYDATGQLLRFAEIDTVYIGMETIDFSKYANGIYLIRVKSKGLPDAVKRVVLQRR